MFKPYPPALVREAGETEELYIKCRCLDPATPKGFSIYRYQMLHKFLLCGETLSDEKWDSIHEYATSLSLATVHSYPEVLEEMMSIILRKL